MKKSLIAIALGGLTIGITEFVMMGLLPDIATDLHISIPVAGYLISAYALGVVIGAPLLVIFGRNYPPKKKVSLKLRNNLMSMKKTNSLKKNTKQQLKTTN